VEYRCRIDWQLRGKRPTSVQLIRRIPCLSLESRPIPSIVFAGNANPSSEVWPRRAVFVDLGSKPLCLQGGPQSRNIESGVDRHHRESLSVRL
jgi:hypothetical protein